MAKYIPEKTYVGSRGKFSTENPPLAFLTPYGTDSSSRNRISTVNKWVKRREDDEHVFEILDNKPMNGFSIGKNVRRWTTSNVVWRVVDPRGFELEISSGNMAYILSECVIDKGVIQGEMIWCRDDKDNYLLPVGSEEYNKYIKNTDIINKSNTIKDIKPGDTIRFIDDGSDFVYLGGYYVVEVSTYGNKFISVKRRHFARRKNIINREYVYEIKSTFKNFSLVKSGSDEDNRDYSSEINLNDVGFLYITVKKPNEKDILNSFEIVNCENPSVNDYVVLKDSELFRIRRYSSNSPVLYKMEINTVTNSCVSRTIISNEGYTRYSSNYYNMSLQQKNEIVESRDKAVSIITKINGDTVKVF